MQITRMQIQPSDYPNFFPQLVVDAKDRHGKEHCLAVTIPMPCSVEQMTSALEQITGELKRRKAE